MDAAAAEDNAQAGPAAQGEESDGKVLLTASFGYVVDELYDPIKHVGEDVESDLGDGRPRALKQIYWPLLKGQMIPQTGVMHQMSWGFRMEDLETPMLLQIVASDLSSADLPQSLKHNGAQTLCYLLWQRELASVKSVLKVKNRRFYSTKPKHWLAEVIVRFGFDPQTRRLSITPHFEDGTAFPASRVIWVDPNDLSDGCSVISMPPPMYSLRRPESFASSLFRRFAGGYSRDDDETEETQSDPPASGTRPGG